MKAQLAEIWRDLCVWMKANPVQTMLVCLVGILSLMWLVK